MRLRDPIPEGYSGRLKKLGVLFLPLHSTGRYAAIEKGKESSNIKHNLCNC
jgi:hypothetical protein